MPLPALLREVSFQSIAMASSTFPTFKYFRLALIQLGGVGLSTIENLDHAREMIHRAVEPQDGTKPNLIVLPVRFENPI